MKKHCFKISLIEYEEKPKRRFILTVNSPTDVKILKELDKTEFNGSLLRIREENLNEDEEKRKKEEMERKILEEQKEEYQNIVKNIIKEIPLKRI